MSTLPTGTVTFLFTDIEGSTRLAQEHPEELAGLLERHHAILQEAIQRHDGYTFNIIGDAFCAAFPTVHNAIEAALEAQRCLSAEVWQPAPIRVRMGISTGSAQLKERDGRLPDYSGYLTLARVQRVMAVAYGGQVLLSTASAELARGELPPGMTLRDMGEHRLKSLLNPEHLWQLVAPDLRQEFPALVSLNAIPNNLPLQLSSFVGRERELAEVRRLLEAHRLVTLTGAGGAGKTRLALQGAAELLDQFHDGAWFVELAPIGDAGLVVPSLLRTFALVPQPGREPIDILSDHLAGRSLLLILDNCEHLLDACCRLAQALLQASPGLHILATGREALNLAGEQAFRVPSLSLPDLTQLPALEQLTQYEAVRLFLERALLVQPEFAVTNANAAAVAQICSRLDGIPLAIELAAARLKSMPLAVILSRLDDRFRLLTGGSRAALPRQQTLRAMIDWSYALLSGPEQTLLKKLSVFRGGCSLEAAEAMCSGESVASADVLDLLSRLVDKSLLSLDEAERYNMLETVRQYGNERLAESEDAWRARDRHLQYFLQLAEQGDLEIRGRQQVAWLARLDAEVDNFRGALAWALESDRDAVLRLVVALSRYWDVRGDLPEAVDWLGKALAITEELRTVPRARALASLCHFGQVLNDLALQLPLGQQAYALASELGDIRTMAYVQVELGDPALFKSPEEGASTVERDLALVRRSGDRWLLAYALFGAGMSARDRAEPAAAHAFFVDALAEAQACGDQELIGSALLQLAYGALAAGDRQPAGEFFQQAEAAGQAIGAMQIIMACALGRAVLALSDESFLRASEYARQAYELSSAHALPEYMTMARLYATLAAWGLGDPDAFVSAAQAAVAAAETSPHPLMPIVALCRLGDAWLVKGDHEAARATYSRALALTRGSEPLWGYCSCMQSIGSLALHEGRPEIAARLWGARALRRKLVRVEDFLPPLAQAMEKALAEAKVRLGEEAFAAEWAAGQALSAEDALALAAGALQKRATMSGV